MSLSRKRIACAMAAGAVLAATGSLAAAQAEPIEAASGNLHGAMAVSRDTGAVSYAVNYASQGAANANAIAECGARDCQVVVEFRNACGAVAQGADGRLGWAWDRTKPDAERRAIDVLGWSAPPFPDLGSASPRPAHTVLSACTSNVG
ncbi:DUF4189 domain-containing protein [Nocardia puris]|uniref:Uncharacterized protein DUF4189 n=1 Tax=Nocardia puris TaxID=208602 RepID=A0A366E1V0_9NOCA|nr:DUF4189 domain-containing protein [Nocardia puris]MBF6209617.1 DUF4189 domain-containing protein [Nocardia puris]MBF6366189.1 DUF4189 domain-containing protein [Nocardia puris]MBF6458472.1 DUF4189 domain-containing protein [Nocardia puris]RBO96115.1 uncharacterized protein DUF4189 [Nocardia puris]